MSDNSPAHYGVAESLLADVPDSKPHVHLITAGGTISNLIGSGDHLSGEEFLEKTPVLTQVADISTHDITKTEEGLIRSRSEYVAEILSEAGELPCDPVWLEIHDHIVDQLNSDDPPDGFVITQGSNPTEETAYFLDLTVDTNRPIVVTAAQRRYGMVGHEGQWNLLCAIRTAGHPDAAGRGGLLVANDLIHNARDVTKVVSGRPDAWDSGDLGVVGLVGKDGLIQFYRQTERQHDGFDIRDISLDSFPRVEVIYSVAGADGRLVESAVEKGADGIVVAAFPTGSPAIGQRPALEAALESDIPVAISHRGRHGWPERKYLEDSPFIWADDLTPQKARLLLALGLLETTDPDALQELFRRY